jgi:hypothetical protein
VTAAAVATLCRGQQQWLNFRSISMDSSQLLVECRGCPANAAASHEESTQQVALQI